MMPKPRRSDVLSLFEVLLAMFYRSTTSICQQSTRFASSTSSHLPKLLNPTMPESQQVFASQNDPNMPKRDNNGIGNVSAHAAYDFLSFYDHMDGVCATSGRIRTTTTPFRSRLLQLSIVSIDTLK